MSEHDSTKVEYWIEQRDWLAARIPAQTDPESAEELTLAHALAEQQVIRLTLLGRGWRETVSGGWVNLGTGEAGTFEEAAATLV
ncbi:MAG TPA: hypothetical protein VNL94_06765 [Candidatus Binatia bacterium]|nr:hypothetical protein [Candidatus Binatia bacterium]